MQIDILWLEAKQAIQSKHGLVPLFGAAAN
jgi:hypothetical protein